MSSPHRFLRSISPSKEPKPASTLRKQIETPKRDAEDPEPSTMQSQFAATPRFGKAKQPAAAPRSPSKLVSALRGATKPRERIEEASEATNSDDESENKRRRVAPEAPQPASRFKEHLSTLTSNIQRPAFLRPVAMQAQEPLPEAFSPHRRGQKFIAGGMAAQMQQHITEIGQQARNRRLDDDFAMRLTIEETNGDNPPLAVGTLPDGQTVFVLLAGGNEKAETVMAGTVIGVRAPTWEVEAEGREWTVCVDWRVL